MAKAPWEEEYDTESVAPWEQEYAKKPITGKELQEGALRLDAQQVAGENKSRPLSGVTPPKRVRGGRPMAVKGTSMAVAPDDNRFEVGGRFGGVLEALLNAGIPAEQRRDIQNSFGRAKNILSEAPAALGSKVLGGMARSDNPLISGYAPIADALVETYGAAINGGTIDIATTPEQVSKKAYTDMLGSAQRTQEANKQYPTNPRFTARLEGAKDSWVDTAAAILGNPVDTATNTLDSALMFSPAVIAAVASGGRTLPSMLGSGVTSFTLEQDIGQYFAQKGIDITTPQGEALALAEINTDRSGIDRYLDSRQIVTALDTASAGLIKVPGASQVLEKSVARSAGRAAAGIGEDAALGMTGELEAQRYNSPNASFNKSDILLEGVAAPLSPLGVMSAKDAISDYANSGDLTKASNEQLSAIVNDRKSTNDARLAAGMELSARGAVAEGYAPGAQGADVKGLIEMMGGRPLAAATAPEDIIRQKGAEIEAQADQQVQQQAEAQRTFAEAGTLIDTTLSELETATQTRLDSAEAKALQSELQDINTVLKEQERYERENVIRSPENNLSAEDKARYGQRQAEIKAKLEAHRAAGSAESRLRELQAKLSKIDNDADLLALANTLSPPIQSQPSAPVASQSQSAPVAAPTPRQTRTPNAPPVPLSVATEDEQNSLEAEMRARFPQAYQTAPAPAEDAALSPESKPVAGQTPLGGERRTDTATRKRIDEMSLEETKRELLVSEITGGKNRRAYQDSEKKPVQVSVDADNLKWVNDNMGHEWGDHIIRAVHQALDEVTENAYHLSGDEFMVQADTMEEAEAIMAEVQDRVSRATIEAILPDGKTITLNGIGVSYGAGQNIAEAESALGDSKRKRAAEGKRFNRDQNGVPSGAVIKTAEGNKDSQSDTAAEVSDGPKKSNRKAPEPDRVGFNARGRSERTDASRYAQRQLRTYGFPNALIEEVPPVSLPDATVNLVRGFESVTGTRVVILRQISGDVPNGFYDPRSRSIFVFDDPQYTAAHVIGHEFSHFLENSLPDLFKRVNEYIAKNGDYVGHAKLYGYNENNTAESISELAANLNGNLFADPEFWRELGRRDKGLFDKLADAVVKFVGTLKAKFGKADDFDAEQFIKDANEYREMMLDIMAEIGQMSKAAAAQRNGASNGQAQGQSAAAAPSRRLQESGRVRGSEGVLRFSRRPYSENGRAGKSLEGLPSKIKVDGEVVEFQAFKPAQQAAERYMASVGLPYNPPTQYAKVDVERATRIANEFTAMANEPDNPEVAESYAAMIEETLAQYRAILDTGLTVEFIKGDDPYGNPRNAILDIVENNHFWVFSTRDGFGSNEDFDPADNPLLAETEFTISGETALANDIFRVVHDYFGHVKEGVGFRADGEENAWRAHSAMYSPLARRAMTTETRGQNSWVNYGPNGEFNRTASPSDTIYADQKIGLLPLWVSEEARFSRRKKDDRQEESRTQDADEQSGVSRPSSRRRGQVAGQQAAQEAKVAPWLPLPAIARPELVPSFTQNKPHPEAVTAYGVHYSDSDDLTALDSKYAGSGSAGRERRRFGMGTYGQRAPDGDTARRLYFYAQDAATPPGKEDVVTGNTKYRVRLDNLYDAENDPLGFAEANRINPDMFEEEVVDAGFDGVLYPPVDSIDAPTIVLFGLKDTVPVQRSGDDPSFSRRIQSSADWTFSPLARMVEKSPLKAVSADQWKKWIAANATKMGVKADELEYTGINEWLDLQDSKVSKEDIAAYLEEGGVRVEESLKSGYDGEATESAIADYIELYVDDEASGYENGWAVRYPDGTMGVYDDNGTAYEGLKPSQLAEELGLDADSIFDEDERAQFEEFKVDGGTNYREIVLYLPSSRLERAGKAMKDFELSLGGKPMTDEQKRKWDELGRKVAGAKPFRSSHWSEENPIAHVRFDIRKDADGNNVLFVNEIQSDWAQKGRKKGFVKKNRPLTAEENAEYIRLGKLENPTQEEEARYSDLWAMANPAEVMSASGSVLSAPFVTDTKAWTALVIKRVIRYAVDNDISRIAFATGDQSIEASTGGAPTQKQRDGAREFYGKIVPQVANEVLRKLGGGKVEKIVITADPFKTFMSGDKAMSLAGIPEAEREDYWNNLTQDERDALIKAERDKLVKGGNNYGFTIPQAVRDKVEAGDVPLFARRKMLKDMVPRDSDPMEPDSHDMRLSIGGQPVRFAFGKQSGEHAGFGAKHITTEIEAVRRKSTLTPEERTPPRVSRDMLEDLVLQAERILRNATELYNDKGKRVYVDGVNGQSVTVQDWTQPETGERYWSVVTVLPRKYTSRNMVRRPWQLIAKKDTDSASKLFPAPVTQEELDAGSARVKRPARVSVPVNYTSTDGITSADPSIQFSRRTPGYSGGKWNGIKESLSEARDALQDSMFAWKQTQDAIEQLTGRIIPDNQNVYRMENLMHGRVADGIRELELKHYIPITAQMNRAGISAELLQDYLIARHAPERNAAIAAKNASMQDGGAGITDAEAAQFMAGLSPSDLRKLESIAAKVDALVQDTRNRMLAAGLITQDAYDGMNQFQFYVPLRGKNDRNRLLATGNGTGQGVDGRAKLVKTAFGRGAGNEAKDVLGEIIGDSQKVVIAAEKARVGRTVLRLVNANPSALWEVEPVLTERALNAQGDVYERTVSGLNDPEVFVAKVNGKNFRVIIKDARLMTALKHLDAQQMNMVLSAAAKLQRYFSAILTQYNPAFIPVNATRDAVFGLTGIAAEHGSKTAAQAAVNYPMAARAAWRYARGVRGNERWDAYASEFAKAGGKTGYVHVENVEDLQRRIGNGGFGGYDPQGLASATRALTDLVSNANDAVENALRLSAYATLREQGVSQEKAAEYAKNLTVNFNRKGNIGQQLNAIILFFNASTQGVTRVGQLMKNPKVFVTLGALSAIQSMLAMYAMGLEGEDGEPLWNTIPDYVKRRNLVIPVNKDTIITIPMPYGFNLFTYASGRVPTAFMQEEERSQDSAASIASDLLSAAVESFSPFPLDEGAYALVPQALKPFLDVDRNEDGLGRAIRKENGFSKSDVPRATLGKPDTMEIFKVAATGLNRLGGGTDYTPPPMSALDVAPEDLEYLLKTFTGGAGQFVMDVASLGEKALADVETYKRDIPIAKRYMTDLNPVAVTQALYYDRRGAIDRKEKQLRVLAKTDEAAAEEFLANTPELDGARMTIKDGKATLKVDREDSVYGAYKAAEKVVDAHRDTVQELYAETPASLIPNAKTAERNRKIKESELERKAAQEVLNRTWRRDISGDGP